MSDNIVVAVRLRPLVARESNDPNTKVQWKAHYPHIVLIDPETNKPLETFSFDTIFEPEITNQSIYEAIALPIVKASLAGINGTIFAYGQTSSGKTFTMSGSQKDPGIVPLLIKDLFQSIHRIPDRVFLLRASYMEIYKEQVFDLLTGEKISVLREDYNGQIIVPGLKEECVTSESMLHSVLASGDQRRKVGETKMNKYSSRSHSIFHIIIESHEQNDGDCNNGVIVSHLNLVDLAGSENVAQTKAQGERLKEGSSINRSLFMLGRVISQLSDGEPFINFRDSKLTRILQNSLGGNAKTAIICNVTPVNREQTLSTIRFALSAKSIQNKPIVNEVLSEAALLKKYATEIKKLKIALENEKKIDNAQEVEQVKEKLAEHEKCNLELQAKILALKEKLVISSSSQTQKNAKKLRRETWSAPMLQHPLLANVPSQPFVKAIPKKYMPPNLDISKGLLSNILEESPYSAKSITPIGNAGDSSSSFGVSTNSFEQHLSEDENSKKWVFDGDFLWPEMPSVSRRHRGRKKPPSQVDAQCQTEDTLLMSVPTNNLPLSSLVENTTMKGQKDTITPKLEAPVCGNCRNKSELKDRQCNDFIDVQKEYEQKSFLSVSTEKTWDMMSTSLDASTSDFNSQVSESSPQLIHSQFSKRLSQTLLYLNESLSANSTTVNINSTFNLSEIALIRAQLLQLQEMLGSSADLGQQQCESTPTSISIDLINRQILSQIHDDYQREIETIKLLESVREDFINYSNQASSWLHPMNNQRAQSNFLKFSGIEKTIIEQEKTPKDTNKAVSKLQLKNELEVYCDKLNKVHFENDKHRSQNSSLVAKFEASNEAFTKKLAEQQRLDIHAMESLSNLEKLNQLEEQNNHMKDELLKLCELEKTMIERETLLKNTEEEVRELQLKNKELEVYSNKYNKAQFENDQLRCQNDSLVAKLRALDKQASNETLTKKLVEQQRVLDIHAMESLSKQEKLNQLEEQNNYMKEELLKLSEHEKTVIEQKTQLKIISDEVRKLQLKNKELEVYSDKYNKAQFENDELRHQNDSLVAKLGALDKQASDETLTKKLVEQQRVLDIHAMESLSKQEKLNQLEEQNNYMKEELLKLSEHEKIVIEQKTQLKIISDEVRKLQLKNKELEVYSDKYNKAQFENDELRHQNDSLVAKLGALDKQASNETLTKKLVEQQRVLDIHAMESLSKQEKLNQLEEQNNYMKEELLKLSEHEKIVIEQKTQLKIISDEVRKLQLKNKELEVYSDKYNKAQFENDELRHQNDSLVAKLGALDKQASDETLTKKLVEQQRVLDIHAMESLSKQEKLNQLEEQNNYMKEELLKLSEHEKTVIEQKTQLKIISDEVRKLQLKNKELEVYSDKYNKAQFENDELRHQNDSLVAKLGALDKQASDETLTKKLVEQQRVLDIHAMESLSKQEKLNQLEEQNNYMKEELLKLSEHEKIVIEQKTQLKIISDEVRKLQLKNKELEVYSDKYNKAQFENDELRHQNDSLVAKLGALDKQASDETLTKKLVEQQRVLDIHAMESLSKQEKLNQLEEQNNYMKEELLKLSEHEKIVIEQKTQLKIISDEVRKLQLKNKELEVYSDKYNKAQFENDELRHQNDSLVAKLGALDKQASDETLTKKLVEQQRVLDIHAMESLSKQEKLNQLEEQNNYMKEELLKLSEHEKTVIEQKTQLKIISDEVRKLQLKNKELEVYSDKYNKAQFENDELRHQNDSLVAKLGALDKQASDETLTKKLVEQQRVLDIHAMESLSKQEKLNQLEEQNNYMKEELLKLSEHEKIVIEQKTQLKIISDEVRKLQLKNKELEVYSDKYNKAQFENDELRHQNDSLVAKLGALDKQASDETLTKKLVEQQRVLDIHAMESLSKQEKLNQLEEQNNYMKEELLKLSEHEKIVIEQKTQLKIISDEVRKLQLKNKELEVYSDKYNKAQFENDELRHQNDSLVAKLGALDKQASDETLTKKLVEQQRVLDIHAMESLSKQEKLNQLEEQNNYMKEELLKLSEHEKTVIEQKTQLKIISDEVRKLQLKNKELEVYSDKYNKAQFENDELRHQNDSLVAKLGALDKQASDETLTKKLVEQQRVLDIHAMESLSKQEKLNQLEEQNNYMKEELLKLSELEKSMMAQEKQWKFANEEVRKLQLKNKELEVDCDKLNKVQCENDKLRAQNDSLIAKQKTINNNPYLQSLIDVISQLKKDLSHSKDTIYMLNEEKDLMLKNYHDSNRKYFQGDLMDNFLDDHFNVIEGFQKKIGYYLSKINSLEEKFQSHTDFLQPMFDSSFHNPTNYNMIESKIFADNIKEPMTTPILKNKEPESSVLLKFQHSISSQELTLESSRTSSSIGYKTLKNSKQNLIEKIEKLKIENFHLHEEINTLRSNEGVIGSTEELEKQLQWMKNEQHKLKSLNDCLNQNFDLLENENTELKQKNQEFRDQISKIEQMCSLTHNIYGSTSMAAIKSKQTCLSYDERGVQTDFSELGSSFDPPSKESYLELKRTNCILQMKLEALNAPAKREVLQLKQEVDILRNKNKKFVDDIRRLQNDDHAAKIFPPKPLLEQKQNTNIEVLPAGFGSKIVLDLVVKRQENEIFHLKKENNKLKGEVQMLEKHVQHYKLKSDEWKTRYHKKLPSS